MRLDTGVLLNLFSFDDEVVFTIFTIVTLWAAISCVGAGLK